MKITLESTTKIVELKTAGGIVPARIWEGFTDSGIAVHAYITRIAASAKDPDLSQFEKELSECRTPSVDIVAIPLRLIL